MHMAAQWKRRMARAKDALMEYAYLITLGAVVAVIAATAMYTERLRTESGAQIQAAADAPEIADTPQPTAPPAITPLPTIAPLTVQPVALRLGGGTVWPVSGGTIRGYSLEEPMYWAALSCMQVHAGTDIAGQAGEAVRCIMDGVVEKTSWDMLWGWRVRIAQTDGSAAVYAGLESCVVSEGQAVARGATLGTLLEKVPCEGELDAHLHLEYECGGVQQDPALLLEHAVRR